MATPVLPVLQDVKRTELLSDPALRELYFGSPDTPGLIAQATEAAQKSFLDQPAILQRTAELSPLEQRARELAQLGIGSYQPFLRTAGQAYGRGLGALQSSLGFGGPSARQLLGLSLQQYDPRMAGAFYDPFEEQVVQQTIQDVLKAGAQKDIAQRAADIRSGGESAFGSRARLMAGERQAAIGRGLGEALARIRSGGFQTAQDRALQELRDIRSGARSAAQLESGFGSQLAGAQRLFGGDISNLATLQQRLAGEDITRLGQLGSTERALEEQRLAREFAQQQAQRQAPVQAASFIRGFAPQYVAGKTQVSKDYGMPEDPRKEALSAALGTYASLVPQPETQASSLNLNVDTQQASPGFQNAAYTPVIQQAPIPAPIPAPAPAPAPQFFTASLTSRNVGTPTIASPAPAPAPVFTPPPAPAPGPAPFFAAAPAIVPSPSVGIGGLPNIPNIPSLPNLPGISGLQSLPIGGFGGQLNLPRPGGFSPAPNLRGFQRV